MKLCFNCFYELHDTDRICPNCGKEADSINTDNHPFALPCGSVLAGKYIIGQVLDVDTYGYLYVSQDYYTKELVTIKEFFPSNITKRDSKKQVVCCGEEQLFEYLKNCFLKQVFALKSFINNPYIVRAIETFKVNNTIYSVMEYVECISLKEHLLGGKLPWEEAIQILEPVMAALITIHGKGAIHRNITPDNILLTTDGSVKILGFSGSHNFYPKFQNPKDAAIIFSSLPAYYAPEVYIKHGRPGPWTDIYAVAAILYHMITGIVPPVSVERFDSKKLIPPGKLGIIIPHRVETALLKALAIKPEERYRTIAEFREDLFKERIQPLRPDNILHWPGPVTLNYLRKIGMQQQANMFYKIQVSVPGTSLTKTDYIPGKRKTVTISLHGWQRSYDVLELLKEKYLNPDREYRFTDWPRSKPVIDHPIFLGWMACVCELHDTVYHVDEYESVDFPTLYGCPNVIELEKRVLSKTVEVVEYELE